MFWGYGCGRVFPAGVWIGPDSSASRDDMTPTSCLATQLSRSVETRRRCYLLPMVFARYATSRAPIWCPSGASETQEAGGTVAESLVGRYTTCKHTVATLYRTSKRQVRRARRATWSSTSQGSAEPLCARIKGANRGISEGKTDLWPWSVFLREQTRSGKRANFVGRFSGMHRALDSWMLACTPASPAQDLHRDGPRCYIFLYFSV